MLTERYAERMEFPRSQQCCYRIYSATRHRRSSGCRAPCLGHPTLAAESSAPLGVAGQGPIPGKGLQFGIVIHDGVVHHHLELVRRPENSSSNLSAGNGTRRILDHLYYRPFAGTLCPPLAYSVISHRSRNPVTPSCGRSRVADLRPRPGLPQGPDP
jgi:hypothetical protein